LGPPFGLTIKLPALILNGAALNIDALSTPPSTKQDVLFLFSAQNSTGLYSTSNIKLASSKIFLLCLQLI